MTWRGGIDSAPRAAAELWKRSGSSWHRSKVRAQVTLREARAMLRGPDCVVRWMAPGSPVLCASTPTVLEAFRQSGE